LLFVLFLNHGQLKQEWFRSTQDAKRQILLEPGDILLNFQNGPLNYINAHSFHAECLILANYIRFISLVYCTFLLVKCSNAQSC